jgi:hypothetical protein
MAFECDDWKGCRPTTMRRWLDMTRLCAWYARRRVRHATSSRLRSMALARAAARERAVQRARVARMALYEENFSHSSRYGK